MYEELQYQLMPAGQKREYRQARREKIRESCVKEFKQTKNRDAFTQNLLSFDFEPSEALTILEGVKMFDDGTKHSAISTDYAVPKKRNPTQKIFGKRKWALDGHLVYKKNLQD